MPRIDPLQLINCLQVLLSPNGGILSTSEVHRLVSLMTKFSKKLVSKCVYVLILKNTESSLLDAFMAAGGWTLIQLWLHDAMYSTNWALVKELLELLLTTPVDVERLKSNNIPKLVKGLSKREDLQGIHELSSQLVQQWLKIVKDETQSTEQKQMQTTVVSVAATEHEQLVEVPMLEQTTEEASAVTEQTDSSISTQTFYKVTLKDGKHLISKVDPSEANYEIGENIEFVEVKNDVEVKDDPKEKEKEKKDEKKKSHDKTKHKSTSSSKSSNSSNSSSSSSSGKTKERSSSHRDKDKHSSSSSSKDKDRSREKDKRDKERDKDRRRSNGSVKSSSKSSSSKDNEKDKKDPKEKQAEKDKDTLAKIQPQSLQKLPKIPKKSSDDKEKDKNKVKENKKDEAKKGSISIEVRKNNEERPKTVKVYQSKMRSTGLEEEAKPAPPRPTKKPGPPTSPVVVPPIPLKRPSPIRDLSVAPPEKKTKIELPLERPGAIKLIPPKPKPPVLQESDMFMDALAASATSKKEPKKRKRRASVSKDSSGSPPSSPSLSHTNAVASQIGLKNIAPPKFYQDTLETDESKSENVENEDGKENTGTNRVSGTYTQEEDGRSLTPTENTEGNEEEPVSRNGNGLKGVLVYMRRKGPKKSIRWKPDDELVDVQYFELDETERVNVTKTFGDLAKMDVRGEREALQMSRKLPNEDVMDIQTVWRVPMEIDLPEALALPGNKSLEKDIQFAREKSVLQALYFSKSALPDSPGEPDLENYQIKDPITIPVEDSDNPEHDFRTKGWPEPKGSPPPQNVPSNVTQMFPTAAQTPFQNFGATPPAAFSNMQQNIQPFNGPPFIPPNVMGGGEWNNVNMTNIHNPQMIPPNMGPPEMINQTPMNPNIFMPPPPDNFNPMMNDNNHRFPPPFNQHQQGPGMFPPNNFNANRGGFGGGFRRGGGNGPWLRMNGPPPGAWNNMRGGGGGGPHRGVRLCNNIRNKGFCRNRDNCPYFHPNN